MTNNQTMPTARVRNVKSLFSFSLFAFLLLSACTGKRETQVNASGYQGFLPLSIPLLFGKTYEAFSTSIGNFPISLGSPSVHDRIMEIQRLGAPGSADWIAARTESGKLYDLHGSQWSESPTPSGLSTISAVHGYEGILFATSFDESQGSLYVRSSNTWTKFSFQGLRVRSAEGFRDVAKNGSEILSVLLLASPENREAQTVYMVKYVKNGPDLVQQGPPVRYPAIPEVSELRIALDRDGRPDIVGRNQNDFFTLINQRGNMVKDPNLVGPTEVTTFTLGRDDSRNLVIVALDGGHVISKTSGPGGFGSEAWTSHLIDPEISTLRGF